MNISDLLEEQGRLRYNEIAIISSKVKCTFGELLKASQEGAVFFVLTTNKKRRFRVGFCADVH